MLNFDTMITNKNKRSFTLHIVPWLVATAFFMQMLDGTVLNTALPAIAKSLNENPLEIQSVVLSYIITVAFFLPLSGWLADRFGSKRIFMGAIILFTLGSLFCAASKTLLQLVLSRIFQGLGGALLVPVGRLEVLKLYPPRMLVSILSFVVIPGLIGPLIGPVVGGFLVEYATWHWIFLINLPVGILCLIASFFWFPDIREENPSKFDFFGFLLFSLFIILISFAVNEAKLIDLTLKDKGYLFLLSLIMLGAYYVYAQCKKDPLFPLGIFKIKTFSIGILSNVCSRISSGAMPFLTPLMLQVGMKFSPSKAGLMMLVTGLTSIAGKAFAPKLIKRLGFRTYLLTNTFFISLLTLCFYLIDYQTADMWIILLLAVFGTFNSLQFTGLTTVTLIDLSSKYASTGNMLFSVAMQISISLGIGTASLILGMLTKHFHLEESADLLPVFHGTYIILGIICALSAIPYLFLPKKKTTATAAVATPASEAS